VGYAFH